MDGKGRTVIVFFIWLVSSLAMNPAIGFCDPIFLASPTSGKEPLTVTFSTTVDSGSWVIDFGDSVISSSFTKDSGSRISHLYSKPGLYRALLHETSYPANPLTSLFVEIVVGGTAQGPTLTSISPSQAEVGTKVMLSGSGLLAPGTEVLIDGNSMVDSPFPLSHLSDSSIEFAVPSKMMMRYRSGGSGSRHIVTDGPSAPGWVLPGRHSISIRNSKGLSNSVYFNLLGTALIDRDLPIPERGVSTNTQATGHPTITGTASGFSNINLSFAKLLTQGRYRLDSPIPVLNGHWSIQLTKQKSWGDSNPLPLQPGTYAISIYDVRTGFPLDTVYLNITTPK